MDILNVMWSGGSAFVSVHKVHRDILNLAGAEVETLVLQEGDAEPLLSVGRVTALGLSARRLKGKGLLALPRYLDRLALGKRLIRRQPKMVLLDGIGVASYVLPLIRKSPAARAVVVFHGGKRLKSAEIALLREFPAERLALVGVSQTLANALQQQIGLPVLGGRVALEPLGFRAALQSREAARRALGLLDRPGRIIGAVGRLVPEKGFALLLESSADWLRHHREDRLVIVGEGKERAHLSALAQELGVAGQVFLAGHLPQAPQLFAAFDLVCLPSEQEGLGLVLSEAVIAGVPVLASDLPVFREQLANGVGLVPGRQPQQWGTALRAALQGDLGRMAEHQRTGLAPEASWERFTQFYRRLLAV